jgi:hypothetical protein
LPAPSPPVGDPFFSRWRPFMPDALSAPSGCKRTRWIWGLPILVALAASGAAAWQVSTRDPTKQPEVFGLLLVERVQPRILAGPRNESPSEDKEALAEYRSTQAALVQSRLVLNAALRNPKVAALTILRDLPEPIEWLEDHLQVDFRPAPAIMRIGLSGKDPKEMCVLVDAVTQAYLDEIVDKENKRRRDRLEQLREIAARFEKKIKDIRASLRKLQEEVGPGDKVILARQGDRARAEYEKAMAELAKVRTELREVKVEVEQAEKAAQQGDTAAKQALAAKRKRLEHLEALEKDLVGDAGRLGREARGLVNKTLDLLEYQREVDEKEELLRTIQKQAAALEVELQAPPRVKRIQEAVIRKKSGK